jgi:uncharacterized membrane protein YsdA (DUF1294 family)/cold shock CspA family protein
MRYKGRITEWHDERGFGFITPIAPGERVFVHIKSFANRTRRPVGNELVTYDVKTDPKGQLRGANVRFSGEAARRPSVPGPGAGSLAFAATFLAVVSAAVIGDRLPLFVLGAYAVGSAITFLVYAGDKSAARSNRWRTKESTLHLLSLLGGWPGALVAQKVLRHKSSKRPFRIVFWGTVVLNCVALIWVLTNPDALLGLTGGNSWQG